MAPPEKFENLVEIMDRLRSDDGCPWDREQTFATLRGYLIEECYEVVEALDRDDCDALREELGDLLFQIVFLARIGKERQAFTAADVVRGISEKMIRRHPHVFADAKAETSTDVLRAWEEIKSREKGPTKEGAAFRSVLDGLPAPLPALPKAQRLGDR
ncbi:MAG: MazG family protein, partial [Acidobacteriota bacterium]|nr:MazG family protein [Acidobacteriota bacterium]